MADPLSVAGTAVSVISLGIQVTQSLVKYYNSYRALDSDLHGTTRRLVSLLDIFQELEKAVTCRKSQGDESNVIKTIEGSIEDCTEYIRELQDECKKFEKHSSGGIKATIKNAGRRVAYPFRQSTLERLDEDISEIRDNLVPALNVLQLNDNENMHDEIVRMRNVVDLVRNDQISSQIHNWLKAPDATIDHNAACTKKQSETGIWFLNDFRFLRWLKSENSFMWMEGFAGSGKSILCSTIIQSVLEHQSSDSNVGIAFFYFTFNDESKRDVSGMLRTLLLQFAGQVHGTHADLTKLWDEYKTKTPSPAVLIECLRHLIEKFDKVFVFLDALDECNRDGPREHVITTLQSMRAWSLPSLHLFVTSRDERDIRQAFDLPTTEHVTMQNTGIDKDIAEYVNAQLRSDQGLQKWAKHQSEIEEALTSRAKGV